jgi:hypothetical protein
MNKNNELKKVINEINKVLKDRDCTGFFLCFTFDDAAGLARYDSSNYLELSGYINLMKMDMEYQMLDSLNSVEEYSDKKNNNTLN